MDEAVHEINKETIERNREAQHRYLTWRAEKVWPSMPIHYIKDDINKILIPDYFSITA